MDEEGWGSDSDGEAPPSRAPSPFPAVVPEPATVEATPVVVTRAVPAAPPPPPPAPARPAARQQSQNHALLAGYAAPAVSAHAHVAVVHKQAPPPEEPAQPLEPPQMDPVEDSPPPAPQPPTPVVTNGAVVLNPLLRAAAGALVAPPAAHDDAAVDLKEDNTGLVPRRPQARVSKTPAALQAELLAAMRPPDAPPPSAWRRGAVLDNISGRLYHCLLVSVKNRYLWANVVYLIYASGILYVDLVAYPAYTAILAKETAAGSTTPGADAQLAYVNRLYLGFAVIHLLNSLMYIVSWWPSGYTWMDWVMIPEYLNVIEASLYLASSTLYPQTGDIFGSTTLTVHQLEVSAAVVELCAALGWYVTWWGTYPRKLGRGWSLDDPDFVANMMTLLPSFVYIAYNAQILSDVSQYGTNFLYVSGDIIYTVGAIFYLIAALRDDGWLWFMPLAGQLSCCRPALNADDIPMPPLNKHDDDDLPPDTCWDLFDCGCLPVKAAPLSARPAVPYQSHAGTEMTRRGGGVRSSFV